MFVCCTVFRLSFQVDQQFYRFLSNFFELHSEFKEEGGTTRPIFFTGESHAGHYIPSMVAYILEQNEAVGAAGKVRVRAFAEDAKRFPMSTEAPCLWEYCSDGKRFAFVEVSQRGIQTSLLRGLVLPHT